MCETMEYILLSAFAIYTDDDLKNATYPVKVLVFIIEFYCFSEMIDSFPSQVSITPCEKQHEPDAARIRTRLGARLRQVRDRSVKNARSLLNQIPATASILATSTVTSGPST